MVEKSSTDPAVSGFVLAGGKSLRMGRDKTTLEFRGIPLLDHMIRLFSTVASDVRIVGKDDRPDKIPGCGSLGGIRPALDITVSGLNLIVAVDLPLPTTGKPYENKINTIESRHVRSRRAVTCSNSSGGRRN